RNRSGPQLCGCGHGRTISEVCSIASDAAGCGAGGTGGVGATGGRGNGGEGDEGLSHAGAIPRIAIRTLRVNEHRMFSSSLTSLRERFEVQLHGHESGKTTAAARSRWQTDVYQLWVILPKARRQDHGHGALTGYRHELRQLQVVVVANRPFAFE